MGIRTKLILLAGLLIFAFTAVILTYRYYGTRYLTQLFEIEVNQQKDNFNDILTLNKSTIHAFAYDYTIWDAMVDFVNSGDKNWAKENIDSALVTYHVDAAWVYKLDGTCVYSTNVLQNSALLDLSILQQAAVQYKDGPRFTDFFVKTPLGIIEIQSAPIQPSSDLARSSLPQGYFFVGRVWSPEYLEGIAKLTGSRIALHIEAATEPDATFHPRRGYFVFTHLLKGLDGAAVVHLQVTIESTKINVFNQAVRNTVTFFIFAMVVIFIILVLSIATWVNVPLHTLTVALQTDSSLPLIRLKDKHDEFGGIARLMVDFFIQREALHKSEELYRLIFQAAGSLIVSLDKVGHIKECNNKVKDLLGYETVELFQKPFIHFVEPESAGVVEGLIHDAIEHSVIREHEFRMLNKNGQPVDVFLNITGMKDAAGAICVLNDITRRKRAEMDLKQANAELIHEETKLRNLLTSLEKKNIELQQTRAQFLQSAKMAAVGRLSAGVAHEIKNPLAIIFLGMEKIDKESNLLTPGARQAIDMVKNATERANKVIKELLYFSHQASVDLTPQDIHQVIRKSISLVENTSRFKNIQFHLNFSDSILGKVNADEILLEQVFLNLFVNAIDAMESKGGGTISVRTYIKQVDSGSFPQVAVEVADTGCGMPADVATRIFEPFFTTKDQGKGTGLGLSTVFMIVEKHRGSVRAESQEGVGTKFILAFPMVEASPETT